MNLKKSGERKVQQIQLKDRFKDKKTLTRVLLQQHIVQHEEEIAAFIAEHGELVQFTDGDTLIDHGSYDQDVFFIITGQVNLFVYGNRFPYTRGAGISVGEMSAIDPTLPRSAPVKAIEDTVTVKLSADNFNQLAETYPKIYRLLAIDLAHRLNQRNLMIQRQNEKPKLFIISTAESLNIARDIRREFDHDDIEVKIWNESDVFKGGNYTLEDLDKAVNESDFGLAIFQDDDVVISRGEEQRGPRDNVILELGLFMGLLTRKRAFVAVPKGVKQKLASDLQGLTVFKYKMDGNNKHDVNNMVHDLRQAIQTLGIRDKLQQG